MQPQNMFELHLPVTNYTMSYQRTRTEIACIAAKGMLNVGKYVFL